MGPWGVLLLQLAFVLFLVRIILQLHPRPRKQNTIIVMGSGGHTSELLRFLQTMENINNKLCPRHYIIADTDLGEKGSENKVLQFETQITNKITDRKTTEFQNFRIHRIPRSREVGQSYFTSVFTTLRAIVVSFVLVWRIKPDLVLANGPGTCLPICFSAWILKVIGVIPHCFIALSESYACVYHTSLTTKLLYPFVNILFVQWVSLLKRYPKAVYSGRIPLDPMEIPSRSPHDPNLEKVKSYVLVTVGTTLFEELIHAVDSVKFGNFLKSLGYTGIHIQHGSGAPPKEIQKTKEFSVEIFPYKSDLTTEIQNADLIIGHAGVGTIFEALEMDKLIVVVPNTKLMNNHQMEISKEMASQGYLQTATCITLMDNIVKTKFQIRPVFPKTESSAWRDMLCIKLKL